MGISVITGPGFTFYTQARLIFLAIIGAIEPMNMVAMPVAKIVAPGPDVAKRNPNFFSGVVHDTHAVYLNSPQDVSDRMTVCFDGC